MKQEEINKIAKEKFETGMNTNLPHIKYDGYVRSAKNMNCECLKCGHKWLRSPNHFCRNNKWNDCPNCISLDSKSIKDNEVLRNAILDKYPNMNILTEIIRTKKTLFYLHLMKMKKWYIKCIYLNY